MKPYVRPNPDTLRAGASHLSFEIRSFYKQWFMLLALDSYLTPEAIAGSGIDELAPSMRNDLFVATLEAWLTHVRALLLAFHPERALTAKGKDDVLFRDYVDDELWSALEVDVVPDPATRQRIDDIGTLLSHLSYRRADGTYDAPQWQSWGAGEYDAVHRRLVAWKQANTQGTPYLQYFTEAGQLIRNPPKTFGEAY